MLVLTQVAVVATALINWLGSNLTFFGESLDRWDYLAMAIGFGTASVLLLLCLLPARALPCSGWVTSLALVLSSGCLVAAAIYAQKAGQAEPETLYRGPVGWAVEVVAWSPAHWGVVVLIAATPLLRRHRLRGSSSPEPRSLQAR